MKTRSVIDKSVIAGFVAAISIGAPNASHADDAPPSYIAAPEVYKVLAENDQLRVVLQTWKPGQRDAYHSHPANAVYWLTDCNRKIYKPDGSIAKEGEVKEGSAVLQKPVVSHVFENVSDKECRAVMVERK